MVGNIAPPTIHGDVPMNRPLIFACFLSVTMASNSAGLGVHGRRCGYDKFSHSKIDTFR